jgi:hypothetical protein
MPTQNAMKMKKGGETQISWINCALATPTISSNRNPNTENTKVVRKVLFAFNILEKMPKRRMNPRITGIVGTIKTGAQP